MADRMELLLEAERRGLLPENKKAALAEARRRGLVPAAPVPMDAGQAPAQGAREGATDQWAMVGEGLSNAGQGVARGVQATAQAGAQLAVRNPAFVAAGATAQMIGQDDPTAGLRQSVDDAARESAVSWQASPAGQSTGGQIGEFVGGAVATAPLAAGSMPVKGAGIIQAVKKGAQGGALGATAMPAVDDRPFWQQKAEQVALGGAVGAGVTGGLRSGMAIAERVGYTPNALAQVANVANKRANRTDLAAEGEALAERTGVRMTPGQVSGSRVQTALENMSRQSIFSSELAAAADEKIANDAINYINTAMDRITRTPAGVADIGNRIQLATKASVGKVLARRDEVAQQQFGPIEQALGGRKFVDYRNTRGALDSLIREYQSVATPEADRIVAQATAMRDRLSGQHNLSEFQRQRGYFGRASQGQGSVFDDVDRSVNQRVASRLYAAMSDDLDASAARLDGNIGAGIVPADYFRGQAQSGGNLSQALREANDNYRRFSQTAEALKAHPIARLFGKDVKVDGEDWFNTLPPEQVVNRLGTMAPSEIRMVRQYMENADPEAWQQYKRMLVQNALDSAQTLPTTAGARQVPFSAATFLRTLGGDKPAKLKQLNELFSAQEMSDIDDAFSVARRLGDQFGRNHSGTGPYNEVVGFMQSLRQRSVEALASTGGEAMGLRKVANVMLNADGRRALIELSRLPPQSKRAASLAAYLSALAANQPAVNPDEAGTGQRNDQ